MYIKFAQIMKWHIGAVVFSSQKSTKTSNGVSQKKFLEIFYVAVGCRYQNCNFTLKQVI